MPLMVGRRGQSRAHRPCADRTLSRGAQTCYAFKMRSLPPRIAQADPRTSPSWAEQNRGNNLRIWRATRIPVLLILGWFSFSHLALKGAWVFVDNFNLLLHEAGHVFFSWAPEDLHILGGSIGQLMWPAFFAGYFWFKRRELFASAACGWWFGENLMNIARYMADAVDMDLPLVGGGEHDYNTLFVKWNVLHRTSAIANTTRLFGVILMLITMGTMVYLTFRPRLKEVEDRRM